MVTTTAQQVVDSLLAMDLVHEAVEGEASIDFGDAKGFGRHSCCLVVLVMMDNVFDKKVGPP